MMSVLFEPYDLAGVKLRNRFVRSATADRMSAPDGTPTAQMAAMYEELAAGGVGLIVSGGTAGSPGWSPPNPKKSYLAADDAIPAYACLTQAAHRHGARVAMQIVGISWLAGEWVAPSPVAITLSGGQTAREITPGEIGEMVEGLGELGRRAREAGFDAVQLHGAHGYALCNFLSPYFNRRTDAYGGDARSRARVVAECIAAIKARAGADYPVFIKMNACDYLPGGQTLEDTCALASEMEAAGMQCFEISGGAVDREVMPRGPRDAKAWREGYFRAESRAVKAVVSAPVMTVGGIKTLGLKRNA